jgi:chromate transporter
VSPPALLQVAGQPLWSCEVSQVNIDRGVKPPTSAFELFLAFAGLSLQSFGGAIGFIERTVVQKKRWLSAPDFLGVFAISQVLPGPTGISFCVLLGDRFFGWRGALAAVAGFLLVPGIVVLSIAVLFQQYQHLAPVQGALHGMGCASVALIITTARRMARALLGHRVATIVAVLSFCAVGLLCLPINLVVLTLGASSVAMAWWRDKT